MPRLYFDGSAISLSNKGVGRYSYELCRRLAQRLGDHWEIDLVVQSDEIPDSLRGQSNINIIAVHPMSDLYRNLIWLPLRLLRRKYNLLLKPMDATGIGYGIPMITVCHDVQEYIDRASGVRRSLSQEFIYRVKKAFKIKNLKNSDMVVCNSMFTRDHAARLYGFNVDKAAIGYCGVDERFFSISDEIRSGGKKNGSNLANLVLAFATGDARERYCLLPEILARLRRGGCDVTLIIAGIRNGDKYLNDLDEMFEGVGLRQQVDYLYVPFLGEDRINELVELYTTADFYLELSNHEGFGMQLAEAMACGTTCISSGKGALAEIAMGFEIRPPSLDAEGFATAIIKSYSDGLHRRDNNEQIKQIYTSYNWDAVADLVAERIWLEQSCET